MKTLTLFFCVTLAVSSCQSHETPKNSEQNIETKSKEKMMTNKEKAKAFVYAATRQDESTVRELVDENYIQHNPYIPTGLNPFIGLFPILKENKTEAKVFRVIQDGDYVVMHHLWTGAKLFGAEEMVSFDILRIDDQGKIAEHWDAMQAHVQVTASGRSMLDGPSEIKDLDKTESNKSLVQNLIQDILMGQNPSKITDYISSESYHQHNPQIKDGLSGISEAIEYLVSVDDMFQYQKIHRIFGEGNFVLSVSEGVWHEQTHVFYDLFRCKNGKVVEHWDVIQAVPTEGLANNNGMFGF